MVKGSSIKSNLDDTLYNELLDGFFLGNYVEGQRLDSGEIAQMYGVSKTPVVQALKRMHNDGLLECTPTGKYYIPVCYKKVSLDICNTRYLLEREAMTCALEKRDPALLCDLRRIAIECDEALAGGDVTGSVKKDLNWHCKLMEACDNQVLSEMFIMIRNRMLSLNYVSVFNSKLQYSAANEHIEMTDCIERGESERVQALLKVHIEQVRDRLVEYAEKNEERSRYQIAK